METTIQHIELINQYLNNLLFGEEKSRFIQKLEQDSEFNQLYHEHVIMVGGISRIDLKQDITRARQTYITNKWIQFSVIGLVVIASLMLLYIFLLKPTFVNPNQPVKENVPTTIQFENKSSKTETGIADSIVTTNPKIITDPNDKTIFLNQNDAHLSYKKPSQILNIDTSKDTIIKCKEGTILGIKANSFVTKGNQKAVKGLVNIEVTEYYKLSDMLLANLTTTSNGKQLETGGMIYIEASQNEAELALKENETISISFPTKKFKENMELFSGNIDEKGMNWSLENNEMEVPKISEGILEVPFPLVEEVPVFPGCENVNERQQRTCFKDGLNIFLRANFNSGLFAQLGLSGQQRITSFFKINENGNIVFIQSNAARPELINEANRVIALLPTLKSGKQRGKNVIVPYSTSILFQVQELTQTTSNRDSTKVTNAVFVNNVIAYDTISSLSRGMVEMIREVMHDADFEVDPTFLQQWEYFKRNNLIRELNKSSSNRSFLIRKQVFETAESPFKILEDDSITRGGHVIRIPWDASKIPTTSSIIQIVPKQINYIGNVAVTSEEFENQVNDIEKTKNVSTRDVNNYILKTAKLGWINCDRFINGNTKRIKYKLKVKNSDNTIINMVFKSVNSIIPSWKSNDNFDFGTVSDASEVVLVAIKKEDGKLFLDIVEVKTTIMPKVDFNMKEVTLEEMKAKLQQLNSSFD